MNSRMTYLPSRSPWRGALVAVTALALLAARTPAQDSDEDGSITAKDEEIMGFRRGVYFSGGVSYKF